LKLEKNPAAGADITFEGLAAVRDLEPA